MRNFVIASVSAVILLNYVQAAKLPDYITACNRTDPQFDECLVKNGNAALPFILKGDADYNIPPLLPLKVPQINIQAENSLTMEFTDCELHGLETASVKEMHVDFEKRKATLKVYIQKLTVLANYDISGRVLILPVQGKGPANITIVDGTYTYEFSFDLNHRRNNKQYQYINFTDYDLMYKAKRIYLKFDNLFNGDKTLGQMLNNFLDENWVDVTNELYPSLRKAVASIVTSIAKGLFSKIAWENLFLD